MPDRWRAPAAGPGALRLLYPDMPGKRRGADIILGRPVAGMGMMLGGGRTSLRMTADEKVPVRRQISAGRGSPAVGVRPCSSIGLCISGSVSFLAARPLVPISRHESNPSTELVP